MNAFPHHCSPSLLAQAVESNLVDFWEVYGRAARGEFYADPRIIRFATGLPVPIFNGIVYAHLQDDNLDREITDALTPFMARRLPMIWWIGPSSEPTSLHAALESYGLVHVADVPGMAIDLLGLPDSPTRCSEFTITPVHDMAALKQWMSITSIAFEIPDAVAGTLFDLEVRIGYDATLSLQRHVAHWKDTPVATATLFLTGDVAGIYTVATVPSARRNGLGSMLTTSLLHKARAQGYQVGILQSSEMGFKVYQRMGFQPCCMFHQYGWLG